MRSCVNVFFPSIFNSHADLSLAIQIGAPATASHRSLLIERFHLLSHRNTLSHSRSDLDIIVGQPRSSELRALHASSKTAKVSEDLLVTLFECEIASLLSKCRYKRPPEVSQTRYAALSICGLPGAWNGDEPQVQTPGVAASWGSCAIFFQKVTACFIALLKSLPSKGLTM